MNNLRRLRRISTFLAVWFGAWLSRHQWVAGNHGYATLLFIADVARVVGYDERQIRRYAIRWGLAHEPRNTLSDDQREKIRRMLRAGCWTYRQIATGTGCSVRTVSDVSAALGLDRTDRMRIRLQRGEEIP